MLYTVNIEKIKRLLLITIGLMAVMIGYYIWLHIQTTEGTKVKPEPIGKVSDADVVVQDVELVEYVNDQVLWNLHAKEAEVHNALKQTRLEGVAVDFFDEQGKSLHLISDYGLKDDQTGNIKAYCNVQADAVREGITLKTDELVYTAATGKITSDKHVIMERGNIITEGDGLESDLSLKKARILRDIKTYFTPGM